MSINTMLEKGETSLSYKDNVHQKLWKRKRIQREEERDRT